MTKTILVLPYTPTLSHISRPLEVAKKLENSGFNILFAGFKTKQSKISFIENEGYRCLPLFEFSLDLLLENIRSGKLAFVTPSHLVRMIEDDILLFKRIKPDLVLSDGRFSAMISTQVCNIPHAAIVNGSSTEYRSIPYFPLLNSRLFDLFGCTKNKRLVSIYNRLNIKAEMFIFDSMMNIFSRLSKTYNLSKKVTATNCLAGKDLSLLADVPEYFPLKNQPESYHYIGPITWKPPISFSTPPWWPLPETGKKQIYITMGTTGEGNLFTNVYNQFKGSDFISIVTTGSQADHFESIPGKIYVENYMDGEMLIKNSDLVVCHGGNGTIYQALSAGKPVLGIPTLPDQDFNMRRVEALGVGIKISMKEALRKPNSIVRKTKYILENMDLFKDNLDTLKNRLKQYSGANMAADLIQNFLDKRL